MNSKELYSSYDYHITSIELRSNINPKQNFDLLAMYSNITINESMSQTFIYGSINIIDTNGLIELTPIVGEHTVIKNISKLNVKCIA
jgi:hypothetical protein